MRTFPHGCVERLLRRSLKTIFFDLKLDFEHESSARFIERFALK